MALIGSASAASKEIKIVADDLAPYDYFSNAVAISGDTAVIGAHRDDHHGRDAGSAYIYTRSGGTWTQAEKLTASDAEPYDRFGRAVAISGDTAAVGAPRDDDHGRSSGAVYIFTRSGDTWRQTAKLTASDATSYHYFGNAVAISGDTMAMTAPGDDDQAYNAGAIYIFTRSGDTWRQQAKLTASSGRRIDYMSRSVAISGDGDTVAVGVPRDDDYGYNSGAVYVFTRSGRTWKEEAKLTASSKRRMDYFGDSVAISGDGDTLVIGAPQDDDITRLAGAAYIFTRSGNTWTEAEKLTNSDAKRFERFGRAVAISGDMVVVGIPGNDVQAINAGAAYLFMRSGNTWVLEEKLTASDGNKYDLFGWSVAISGDTAVVGASFHASRGRRSGAAYIFE